MSGHTEMAIELFHKQLFWLPEWFSLEKLDSLPFTEPEQQLIFTELAKDWKDADVISRLNVLHDRFGEKLLEVLSIVINENARRDWQAVASQMKSHTIDDLIRVLWKPLREQGFEFTQEQREDGVQMHCTRCPHVDLAKALGAEKWIFQLICMIDPPMTEGFNPNIGFRRSKTLIQGDEYCDHFYFMKKQD